MVKLDKHIRVTGFIAMAIAIATMVLLVVNAVHNGILAEDTPLIQGMKLLLICVACYFLGLAIADGMVYQEMKQDKIEDL